MKQCPNCKFENEEDAVVCTNCGRIFGANNAQQYNPYGTPNGVYSSYPEQKNNGYATASLVLGIFGLCCTRICAILAIIFGFIARKRIRESGGAEKGDGMALAGIIMGFIGLGVMILAIVILFALLPEFVYRFSNTYQDYFHSFKTFAS